MTVLRPVFIRTPGTTPAPVTFGWNTGNMIGELLTVAAFVSVGLLIFARWWEERPPRQPAHDPASADSSR